MRRVWIISPSLHCSNTCTVIAEINEFCYTSGNPTQPAIVTPLPPLSPEGCLYALRPQSLQYREVDTTSSWCHDPTVTQLTWREAGQITHRVQLKHVELAVIEECPSKSADWYTKPEPASYRAHTGAMLK